MTIGTLNIPIFGDPGAAFSLAQTLTTTATKYANELVSDASNFSPIYINAVFPTISDPPKITIPSSPDLQVVKWVVPDAPDPFSILPPDLTKLFPQAFDGQSPTLNFGSLPQPQYGDIPQSPSVDFNFSYPDASVDLPKAPSLFSLSVVDFNPFDIPTFDGTTPEFTIAAPTPINYVEGQRYTSDLLDDVTGSLEAALTSGTDTGLSTDVLQAEHDAASEREFRSQADALADLDRMANLGYAFPPGVYLDARLKVQTETNYTRSGLSRDIYVADTKLRLDNVMKSRELAIGLESKWIDYQNQVNDRAFQNAKYQTEAQISIYNGQVQAYGVRVEAFKATIQVYETVIRGIEMRIEQLKAQVSYEQTKAQINQTLVDTYRAQIQAAMSTLDIAKIQVEIIQTRAQVEKTKVDVFGAQVQAFVATVNAYTAEVEGYKANAEAQGAIENVFRTQVEAYSAQVQAGSAQANALVEGYKAQVQAYETKLDSYKANLQAMVEQARATSEFNQAATAEYTALVQATSAYNQALTSQWEAVLNEQVQICQIAVKAAEANAQIQISQRQLTVEAIKGAATVMSQLGAAALNAIHFSNTSNWGLNQSLSVAYSTSSSTSENHNFNESA